MSNPQPPYPQEALARFRAAADTAVEQGRRAAGEARDRGAASDRQTFEITERLSGSDSRPEAERRTPADLRAAARQYRVQAGLPVPDLPTGGGLPGVEASSQAAPREAEDEDFSQDRIMRKL